MRTLTALFDTREAARDAQADLVAAGVATADVDVTEQSAGAATATDKDADPHRRGVFAAIKDFFLPDDDHATYEEGLRRGGFLLTARIPEALTEQALEVLERSDAIDLDARAKDWEAEGWARSSLTATPAVPAKTAETTDQTVPVVAEQLRVGKRDVARGGVRVRSYVVETPVEESVTLRQEHVEVERRPVNTPIADAAGLLEERVVEVVEHGEEAVVAREAVVVEEVVVRKGVEERVETVRDTVRHTEVDIEDIEDETDVRRTRPSDDRPASTT